MKTKTELQVFRLSIVLAVFIIIVAPLLMPSCSKVEDNEPKKELIISGNADIEINLTTDARGNSVRIVTDSTDNTYIIYGQTNRMYVDLQTGYYEIRKY